MTTVVIDTKLGIMASDNQFTDGNYVYKGEPKIERMVCPETGMVALVGAAGAAREMVRFKAHFKQHFLGKDSLDISKRVSFGKLSAIAMLNTGETYEFDGDNTPLAVRSRWHGIGSGRDFAIGALYSGKTPRAAIQIAAKLDNGTGHGVKEIRFGKD
jgi:ATP-dependent protease HslVU (ClpYQ) peptidase subunit